MHKEMLPEVDVSGSLVGISHSHHKIHDGKLFALVHEAADITSASSQYYLLRTPASGFTHLSYVISADAKSIVRFFEAPTTSADGSAMTPHDANRVLDNTPTLLAFSGPTVTSPGTLLSVDMIGSAGGPAHSQSGGHADVAIVEWVLKQSTDYLIQAEANGSTTNFALQASFYELG